MKKTITWLLIAAAILIIYIIAAKTLVLPWIGDQVAALLVGTIGLVSGLFFAEKTQRLVHTNHLAPSIPC